MTEAFDLQKLGILPREQFFFMFLSIKTTFGWPEGPKMAFPGFPTAPPTYTFRVLLRCWEIHILYGGHGKIIYEMEDVHGFSIVIWLVVTGTCFIFHSVGNVIIPTVTHSIIFQRGRYTTNQSCSMTGGYSLPFRGQHRKKLTTKPHYLGRSRFANMGVSKNRGYPKIAIAIRE